tara:strand:- start:8887 stop:9261 length:375 start_codon:yes stop_codon:yes gene_type:complete
MNVNTGVYWNKIRNDVCERRVAAGKTPIYTQYALLAGAEVYPVPLDTMKYNESDGIATGFIRNNGPEEISISVNLRRAGTVLSPEIIIKVDGEFDFGQFHGLIYGITVTNLDATAPTLFSMEGS